MNNDKLLEEILETQKQQVDMLGTLLESTKKRDDKYKEYLDDQVKNNEEYRQSLDKSAENITRKDADQEEAERQSGRGLRRLRERRLQLRRQRPWRWAPSDGGGALSGAVPRAAASPVGGALRLPAQSDVRALEVHPAVNGR
jgi:hypothetical protein